MNHAPTGVGMRAVDPGAVLAAINIAAQAFDAIDCEDISGAEKLVVQLLNALARECRLHAASELVRESYLTAVRDKVTRYQQRVMRQLESERRNPKAITQGPRVHRLRTNQHTR